MCTQFTLVRSSRSYRQFVNKEKVRHLSSNLAATYNRMCVETGCLISAWGIPRAFLVLQGLLRHNQITKFQYFSYIWVMCNLFNNVPCFSVVLMSKLSKHLIRPVQKVHARHFSGAGNYLLSDPEVTLILTLFFFFVIQVNTVVLDLNGVFRFDQENFLSFLPLILYMCKIPVHVDGCVWVCVSLCMNTFHEIIDLRFASYTVLLT